MNKNSKTRTNNRTVFSSLSGLSNTLLRLRHKHDVYCSFFAQNICVKVPVPMSMPKTQVSAVVEMLNNAIVNPKNFWRTLPCLQFDLWTSTGVIETDRSSWIRFSTGLSITPPFSTVRSDYPCFWRYSMFVNILSIEGSNEGQPTSSKARVILCFQSKR